MALETNNLDKRIADLEEIIKVYEVKYFASNSKKEKERLIQVIEKKQETANRLLDEKKAQDTGLLFKLSIFPDLCSLFLQDYN